MLQGTNVNIIFMYLDLRHLTKILLRKKSSIDVFTSQVIVNVFPANDLQGVNKTINSNHCASHAQTFELKQLS